MDSVLRAVPSDPDTHNMLAYADDAMLTAESPEELQTNIDMFSRRHTTFGLNINPKKFVRMHLTSNPRGCKPTTFTVDGIVMPHMADGLQDRYWW